MIRAVNVRRSVRRNVQRNVQRNVRRSVRRVILQPVKVTGVVALVLAPSCASLLKPSGSGETVTDPVTGEQREETVADDLVQTGQGLVGVLNPSLAPIAAVGGMALAGLIGAAKAKKKG